MGTLVHDASAGNIGEKPIYSSGGKEIKTA